MYTLDPKTNLITKGFDVPEPTLKSGSFSLALLSLATKFISEPIRVIPFAAWIAYCYFLFFSTDTPGLNALALDPATWQEVKDLSLNYWLILPTLSINTAPTVHPILEGTFNLLLAWVTLFVGFAVDGRSSYGNKNKFTGPLLGMQLLTNAIYLPYLVTRESLSTKYETTGSFSPSFSSLNMIEKIGESKITPIVLSAVGIYAMYWGATARADIYLDLPTRLSSFLKLFQTDRLTFSFVVDLFCLAIFQGWLVDDDAALRKGTSLNESVNEFNMLAAKYVPFFGLAYYLISRPSLPRSK